MKKLTALLLALVFVTMAFVSCSGGSPAGKTFKFDSVDVSAKDASADDIKTAEAFYEEMMKGTSISFTDDKVTFGEADGEEGESMAYTMDGNKVVVDEDLDFLGEGATITYKSGKITLTASQNGVTVKLIFK